MSNFYRYIYKVGKGYQIRKNGVNYGYYENILDALYDRDDLIECNWDMGEWVYIQPHHNKYEDMELPPWNPRDLRFIYQNGNGWKIERRNKYYGQYATLKEAVDMRNKLMESDWNAHLE